MPFETAKDIIMEAGLWSQTSHISVGSTMFGDSHKVKQFFDVLARAQEIVKEKRFVAQYGVSVA
jgi:hypothetical protein